MLGVLRMNLAEAFMRKLLPLVVAGVILITAVVVWQGRTGGAKDSIQPNLPAAVATPIPAPASDPPPAPAPVTSESTREANAANEPVPSPEPPVAEPEKQQAPDGDQMSTTPKEPAQVQPATATATAPAQPKTEAAAPPSPDQVISQDKLDHFGTMEQSKGKKELEQEAIENRKKGW